MQFPHRLDQLYNDFDLVSATFIKTILKGNQFFYSPAYLALRAAVKAGEAETIAKRRTDKKLKDGEPELPCAELEKEKDWLRTKIRTSHSSRPRSNVAERSTQSRSARTRRRRSARNGRKSSMPPPDSFSSAAAASPSSSVRSWVCLLACVPNHAPLLTALLSPMRRRSSLLQRVRHEQRRHPDRSPSIRASLPRRA